MLSAYDSILQGIPYVSAILVTAALLSLVLQKSASIARSILFSFGFWLAPLFYATYMGLAERSSIVITAAFLVDVAILVVYYMLFVRLLHVVSDRRVLDLTRLRSYLKWATLIVIVLAIPLAFQKSVGIFSTTDSRIDYFTESKWNPYLVYGSLLTQATMIPIIAAIINCEKRWNGRVICYLIITSALSVLSASKGAAILSLLAILSLVKFPKATDYVRILRLPVFGIITIFFLTVYFVGKFLSLHPIEIVSLMFSRIFLTNDARALAIDWSGPMNQHSTSLFSESFRAYASLLGNIPAHPPLGQYLYMQQFGSVGLIGANASSSALLIAYGNELDRALFAVGVCLLACIIYLLVGTQSRHSTVKMGAAMFMLSLLSQDFLAFQLCAHIFILIAFAFVIGLLSRKILVGACRSARKGALLGYPA